MKSSARLVIAGVSVVLVALAAIKRTLLVVDPVKPFALCMSFVGVGPHTADDNTHLHRKR
jgi:hypothetical protein